MDWSLFQLACAAVLLVAYVVLFRLTERAERARLARMIALIAVSAWAGEETSILRYAFYGYPDSWWLKLDEVPLIVVAIWPLVVLTASQVIESLFPRLGRVAHAAAIGVMVFIDASLVETVAVAANLWSWAEGGYLGVPVIGLIGWAAYAFSIALFLPGPGAVSGPGRQLQRLSDKAVSATGWLEKLSVLIISLAITHALLVVSWWALFRHALRGEWPAWSAWVALALSAILTVVLWRRGRRIPLAVAAPRGLATSVFVVLLALYADGWPLVVHFGAIALPYLALIAPTARGEVSRRV
jgi:hypothetical protein